MNANLIESYFFVHVLGYLRSGVQVIPDAIFANDLTNLMSGYESSTFVFDLSAKSFSTRRLMTVASLSPETLQSFTEKFIQVIFLVYAYTPPSLQDKSGFHTLYLFRLSLGAVNV